MDLMTRRRLMLAAGKKQSRLPVEYQEVEWLEGTGTQYIDTGVKMTGAYGVEIDVSILGSGTQRVFGSYSTRKVFAIGQASSGSRLFLDIYSSNYRVLSDVAGYDTGFHHLRVENKGFAVDGVSYGTSGGTVSTQSDNAFLLAYNQATVAPAYMRSKDCLISDGITVVRTLVPCYRKADGKPGMYDLVSKEFFTNAGSGEFAVGPDVN